MKGYTISRAVLLAAIALLVAATSTSTASARMAPPEPAVPGPSTPGVQRVTPGVRLTLVKPAKKKHVRGGHAKVAVPSTTTGNWAIPSGCTLGYSDDYVWGYTCSGNSATGSTTVAAPATRTGESWAIPSGCTLGFDDGYVWGYSC
jgi:hypothetical protein